MYRRNPENCLPGNLQKLLLQRRDVALANVKRNGCLLKHFPTFTNDRDIVKAAVTQNGRALEFADATLTDRRKTTIVNG